MDETHLLVRLAFRTHAGERRGDGDLSRDLTGSRRRIRWLLLRLQADRADGGRPRRRRCGTAMASQRATRRNRRRERDGSKKRRQPYVTASSRAFRRCRRLALSWLRTAALPASNAADI